MRTSTAALLLALLLGVATAAGPALAAAGAPATQDSPGSTATTGTSVPSHATVQDEQSEAANETGPVTIEIQVRENGNAEITLWQEFRTETTAEEEAFEAVANDYRFGRRDLGVPAFQAAAEQTDPTVERDMSVTEPELNVEEGDTTSRIERSFTWTNFANESDGEIVLGDAFVGENGLWLRTLESHTRLVVLAPEGYRVTDTPQGPRVRDGEALIWNGYRTFEPEDLQVSFAPERESNVDSYLLLAGVGLVILAAGALMLRREGEDTRPDRSTDRLTDLRIDGVREALPWVGGDVQGAGGETGAAAGGGTAAEPAREGVDPELLSDEERVEWLLEQNGGRMKQSNIVAETGWSNAKVSQLLSEMDEDDRLDKLRIGRENLITLPDEDVTEDEP